MVGRVGKLRHKGKEILTLKLEICLGADCWASALCALQIPTLYRGRGAQGSWVWPAGSPVGEQRGWWSRLGSTWLLAGCLGSRTLGHQPASQAPASCPVQAPLEFQERPLPSQQQAWHCSCQQGTAPALEITPSAALFFEIFS